MTHSFTHRPSPFSLFAGSRLRCRGGGGGVGGSMCEISEVIVTEVAELRPLRRLVGFKPPLICRLFPDWRTVFISKLCYLQLWQHSLGTTCAEAQRVLPQLLFASQHWIKSKTNSITLWSTASELISPTIHSKSNVKANKVIKRNVFMWLISQTNQNKK